jgi:hypothetical protein
MSEKIRITEIKINKAKTQPRESKKPNQERIESENPTKRK